MTNLIKTSGKHSVVEVQLDVLVGEQGEYFVALCPALDLSSFGDSEKDALKGFEEALDLFLIETKARGTIEKILLDLGWKLQKLPTVKYTPPSKRMLSQMAHMPKSRRINERVSIPID
jgi:predicted RNase H-like HicB family nuclease